MKTIRINSAIVELEDNDVVLTRREMGRPYLFVRHGDDTLYVNLAELPGWAMPQNDTVAMDRYLEIKEPLPETGWKEYRFVKDALKAIK